MKLIALAGGVGGAKLVDGFAQLLPPEDLTVIVNTGDDFEHLGLSISPDLDTVCYTLAGIANPETGWGRAYETFEVLDNICALGGETWFRLGDKDLATHLERTRRLKEGQTLTQITRDFCHTWGVHHAILPMSDQPVRTMVDTVEFGELPFQEYFVHRKCEPKVKGFRFAGIETARPAPGVIESIATMDAIVICPSNPWVSIDPILAVLDLASSSFPLFPSSRSQWEGRRCESRTRYIAISPIIGGQTVKGPAAKMYTELGITPSALAVARHYSSRLTHFVLDQVDQTLAAEVVAMSIRPLVTNTLMNTPQERCSLAQDVLNLIQSSL